MSWAPEVQADGAGIHKWSGNGLRFATKKEAEAWVYGLSLRWLLVTDTRVVESSDPVNYAFVNGNLESVGNFDRKGT